jgi:glycosyltransferase involved in cell wall biosynthesis
VRPLLRRLAAQPDVAVTLLTRDADNVDAYHQLVGTTVQVAPLRAAWTNRHFECVWYPWNGIRFPARAPSVVTINDDFAFAFPATDIVGRWREQRPIRRAIRTATRIATISGWSREALITRFAVPAARIDLLPLAPDPFFTPGHEASPYGQPFILTVGAGETRKNVGFLIDAFNDAYPSGGVTLIIVGALPHPVAQRVHRLGRRAIVLDRPSDEELRRLYRTAAAVAVPSRAEGFGLVAAEAQACGAVVIASNTTALPEAVGSAGILLDPHDRGAWRDAIRRIVDDPSGMATLRLTAAARWVGISPDGTLEALRAAFERAIDNRP